MSALEPNPTPRQEPPTTIALRVGGVVTAALVLTVAVNLFAGSLAFAVLLAGLAAHTAWNGRETTGAEPRRPAAELQEPATTPAPWETATPPLAPSTPAAGASAST